jgi:hypothetical protein
MAIVSPDGNPDDGEAERRVGDEGRVLGGDVLRVDGVVNDAAIGATELPDADLVPLFTVVRAWRH